MAVAQSVGTMKAYHTCNVIINPIQQQRIPRERSELFLIGPLSSCAFLLSRIEETPKINRMIPMSVRNSQVVAMAIRLAQAKTRMATAPTRSLLQDFFIPLIQKNSMSIIMPIAEIKDRFISFVSNRCIQRIIHKLPGFALFIPIAKTVPPFFDLCS